MTTAVEEAVPSAREPRTRQWRCNDGWIVGYSTETYGAVDRPEGNPMDWSTGEGQYAWFTYKPDGDSWVLHSLTYDPKRAVCKDRALEEYFKHNDEGRE